MPRPAEPAPVRPTEPAARGRTFDDLELGQTFASEGRTVTQADVSAFADISGDFNPLHVDEEFARRTPFRGRIAHGLLVQSIASGLAWQTGIFEGTIAALKEMVIRFQGPVLPGDTVRLELRVAEKDPSPSPRRGWVRFDARVTNQRGDVVIGGEWLTLLLRGPLPGRGRSGRGPESPSA
jgi:acyl dehydratase